MSIKNHALLVSMSVNKPQMTAKDAKATRDAEAANNAHGAGNFRKNLYPPSLVKPIIAVESAARAYMESHTYSWARGQYLLPTAKFMEFADRMAKFEVEFHQAVTAFLNNWSSVMLQAEQSQGDLFNANEYPDLADLKAGFRFRVGYSPVTDTTDFRVQMQDEEMEMLRAQVEQSTKESMDAMLRTPLERLKEVVARLHEVTGKPEREVIDKRTGKTEVKAPIFRDSVCDNIMEEIELLRAFADILPPSISTLADTISDAVPNPDLLRADKDKRDEVNTATASLLAQIDNMLDD